MFLSLVHRVHVGVARSLSGSPWGPYTDPLGIVHIMTISVFCKVYFSYALSKLCEFVQYQ